MNQVVSCQIAVTDGCMQCADCVSWVTITVFIIKFEGHVNYRSFLGETTKQEGAA